MNSRLLKIATLCFTLIAVTANANSEATWIDLTHPIPTFHPIEDNPTRSDLTAPWLNSTPHVTWYQHAILTINVWDTDTGYYDSGKLVIDEHHGTHLDAINHIINTEDTMVKGGIPNEERPDMSSLTTDDLIGPIILIDISPRVRAELSKNDGTPSPNIEVTDFSENSNNVVTAEDIDAIAGQLKNGVWIIANLGWAQFYMSDNSNLDTSPYFNNFNHPGFTRAAVNRLAEIIDERGLKLGGIGTDNITIDTGEGAKGDGPTLMKHNAWHSHSVLMQRGVLFLENLANVDQLAMQMNNGESCTVIIGAPKHVRGTGGPSRVFAMCES